MSSDNGPPPPRHKPSTSSFADVFKTLRQRSPAQFPSPDNIGDVMSNPPEGRRGSRVTFGLESLQRVSTMSNSSDSTTGPDFEASLKNLQQRHSLSIAAEEAEIITKSLYRFTPDQSIMLWEAGAHLIYEEDSPDARKRASKLLEAVASRQDLSPAAKNSIFVSISRPSPVDVIPACIHSLISLSDNGRKLDFTASSILPILSSYILPLYESLASARSKARKGKASRANGPSQDEENLSNLFQFVIDVITLQRNPANSDETEYLLTQVFTICKRTSVAADIKNSLAVFEVIILYAEVPDSSFVALIKVLCNIHASVKSLSGPTSRAVRNLAKTRKKRELVTLLHSVLETPESQGRNLNVVRGAIYAFTDLIRAYGQDGLPQISSASLIKSLWIVAEKDGRIEAEILELCVSMLEGDFVNVTLREERWNDFVDILILCSYKTVDEQKKVCLPTYSYLQSRHRTSVEMCSNILANVMRIATSFEVLWGRMNNQQILGSGRFYMVIHQHLKQSQAKLLLSLFRAERLCWPGTSDWVARSRELIQGFLRSSDKASDVRVLALEVLKDAFSDNESLSLFQEKALLEFLLEDFASESDPVYLQSLVSFTVDIASGNDDAFRSVVDKLGSPMKTDYSSTDVPGSQHSSSMSDPEQSLSNICSVGLVALFLRSFNASSSKTARLSEALLNLIQSWERAPDCRLTALKLLFRLRCDSLGMIYVVPEVENDDLIHHTVDVTSQSQYNTDIGSSERHLKGEEGLTGRSYLKSTLSSKLGIRVPNSPRPTKWTSPTYSIPESLPEKSPTFPSSDLYAHTPTSISQASNIESDPKITLKVNMWLETVIALLQHEVDWDVYTFVLTRLGAQLSNRDFFSNAIPQIKLLRSVLCDQIKNETFHEPPAWTGAKKADVAICIFEALAMLIIYHEHFAKSEQDELIRVFMLGIIGSWDGTSRGCIHALSVCCHEIPLSVTKSLGGILDKMSKVITMSHLAVHILEFLALLARLPDVYINLREEEIRTVFGICVRFLQTSREQRHRMSDSPNSRGGSLSARLSGGIRELGSYMQFEPLDATRQEDVSRYVRALTYHVMIFWFLSLKLQDRAKHVNWITSRLIFTDEHGKDVVEEQSQVFIDLMQRAAYSDLGDTLPSEIFPPSLDHGPVVKKSWIVGMSIVTIETAGASGLTQITKRQASGTTYAIYQQRTTPVCPYQVPPTPDALPLSDASRTSILPSHVLLQMTTTAFPTPLVMQPISLPDDDMTRRAISSFDRNNIVDGHKIGVIYIGRNQTSEVEILANTRGSPDYEHFLAGLGTKVALRGAQFNTQGLHCDIDGEHTYAWRDRVTEIVYHVATMMPTHPGSDPSCVNKKRHVGNDFVNIIFNRSNLPFNFETIPSQYNFVNIIITPVCRIADHESVGDEPVSLADFNKQYYIVKVMSKSGFPELSPAAVPKAVSGKNLGAFVRILALNASVFSLVWDVQGGEHVSSWGNRLREIKRLRERFSGAQPQTSDIGEGSYPGHRRSTKPNIYSEEGSLKSTVRSDFGIDWNAAADNNTIQTLDFSRWGR